MGATRAPYGKEVFMDDPSEKPSRMEKVNFIIRIILAVGTVAIILVALYGLMKRGSGY
jgi:hypothetical protein